MKQFAAHKACFRNAGPALRTALEYLLGGSYRDSIDEKGQVPPFNTLAKWAGVSRDSMLKAAKLLRDAGFFAGIRGQRYRFISVATATKSPPNNASGRAAESIRADLLNGIYAPGAHLPSVKQLQWKYNVSFPTIKKALSYLVANRDLIAAGRHYAVPGGRIAQEGARIILLAPAGSDPLYYELGVAGEPVQREIESACTRCGVGLESFVFSYESGYLNLYRPGSTRAEKLPDDHLVLGYIVIAVIPDFLPEDLIVRLADTRTPSAIIDIAGIPRIPLGMTANQYIQFFTMSAGSTPGVHVARFLKNLGHKRIAWISPYHKSEWSRQRLKGLQSLYPGSERSPGVYCLSIEKILPSDYAATSIPPHHTQKLDNFFRSWARDIADIPRAYFDEQKSEFARNALDYTEMLAALVPLFERLLKQRTITAWVAANDYVADMAYRFLRYKKIAIPARISLAGFDDTDLSLRRGITSYNFNAAALANAAASFCLDFSAKGKSARGVVEIEGRMTVRATTGRPSAQS